LLSTISLRLDKPRLEKGNLILTFVDTQIIGLETSLEKHRKEAMVSKIKITHP
jgi:hypothetical protein